MISPQRAGGQIGYAAAKVLGNLTVGDDSRIGANAVLLRSVDHHSVVVGVPGQIIASHGSTAAPAGDPDPVTTTLQALLTRVATLEEHVSGRVEPSSLYVNAAGDWESSDFVI